MKIAIVETIVGAGGHEIEHDRQIADGLRQAGHQLELYVPEGALPADDYGLPVKYLVGKGISYAGVHGLKKIFRSVRREINRKKWYKQIYDLTRSGAVDAVLFPMTTHRFLSALAGSPLRLATVPVLFGVIGVAGHEQAEFRKAATALVDYDNIRIVNFTVESAETALQLDNIYNARMSLYMLEAEIICRKSPQPLRLGFLGQYRREKDMAGFLRAFRACRFDREVMLEVQMAALNPRAMQEMEAVQHEFGNIGNIKFIRGKFYGQQWNELVSSFDALVVPYANERYRQNGSGVLLTALGAGKPVVIADSVWPELLKKYRFGEIYETGNQNAMIAALEQLVNNWDCNVAEYCNAIRQVRADYSPLGMAEDIVKVIEGKRCE